MALDQFHPLMGLIEMPLCRHRVRPTSWKPLELASDRSPFEPLLALPWSHSTLSRDQLCERFEKICVGQYGFDPRCGRANLWALLLALSMALLLSLLAGSSNQMDRFDRGCCSRVFRSMVELN